MGDTTFLPDASLQGAVVLLLCLGAGALWYEWRLNRLRRQLHRTKADNQALGERALQARLQVESLQQHVNTAQAARPAAQGIQGIQRSQQPQAEARRDDEAAREQRVQAMLKSLDEADRRAGITPDTPTPASPQRVPVHGFADTQPMMSASAAALAEARANHGFADTEPMCIWPHQSDAG